MGWLQDIKRLIPPGGYQPGHWGALVHKKGYPQDVVVSENSNVIPFTEKGVGVHPLAIIGNVNQILLILDRYKDYVIENQIPELPNIYMGLTLYEPGPLYSGLFPVHDSVAKLIQGAADIGGGGLGEVVQTPIASQIPSAVASAADALSKTQETIKELREVFDGEPARGPMLIPADQKVEVILHYLEPKSYVDVVKVETVTRTSTTKTRDHTQKTASVVTVLALAPQVIRLVASCTTKLPAWEDWKKASSAGTFSLRSKSRIVEVDRAYLQYFGSVTLRSVEKRATALKHLAGVTQLYCIVKRQEKDQGPRLAACEKLLGTIGEEKAWLGILGVR
jgi:hypothetical protein